MKKRVACYSLACAVALGSCIVVTSAQAVTLIFTDNINPTDPFPGFVPPPLTDSNGDLLPSPTLTPGNEFCIAGPNNATCATGQKSLNKGDGSEKWIFDDATGQLLTTQGYGGNPGSTDPNSMGFSACSLANDPNCPTLHQPAHFIIAPFAFLAPALGSPAGDAYGVGTIKIDGANIEVFFPVLEAQWSEQIFLLGKAPSPDRDGNLSTGILFQGTIDGNTFRMIAHHKIIAVVEDPGAVGFGGYLPQWELTGTIVPVPAAVWLLGSGLAGLFGFARHGKRRRGA